MADLKTFQATALPHLDALYRAAMALCGNRDTADDLVQATFLKAMESFGRFQAGTNCKSWLLRILRNTWIDQLRHRKAVGREITLEEDLAAGPETVEPTRWTDASDLIENFGDAEVIDALQALPEDQRLTLYLVDVEKLSLQEVAEITDTAVGTVKSRSSRARSFLRERLLEHARRIVLAKGDV